MDGSYKDYRVVVCNGIPIYPRIRNSTLALVWIPVIAVVNEKVKSWVNKELRYEWNRNLSSMTVVGWKLHNVGACCQTSARITLAFSVIPITPTHQRVDDCDVVDDDEGFTWTGIRGSSGHPPASIISTSISLTTRSPTPTMADNLGFLLHSFISSRAFPPSP